ncbi:MAG: FAD-binding oxidoreductase [Anaerolineales bacterium]|jgi:sarcosine oxidase subunit beta|nr:FAD-binding oxidoreductase [Anaerolineales bacterium]
MKTDVIIIGGGIAGCATAYYLAKKGMRATVLEKEAAVGLEASGRCACGVRQQGRKAALPLAMGSVRIWAGLAEELGCDLEYRRTGNLKVVWEAGKPEELAREAAWEHEQGLSEVRMVTAAECQEIVPGLTGRTLAGKLCPTDGMANPMRVTPAFARAASRLGALIRTRTRVTGLLKQGEAVCGVMTDKGEFEAEVVINTAGPWAEHLNTMAGCPTPIRPGLDTLMITERQPHRFTPFLGFGWWGYALQPKSGNLIIGLEPAKNEAYDHRVEQADIAEKARDMMDILPWLEEVTFLRSFSGVTEYTPDKEPYIGAIPGCPGMFTAAGFSGQGFCLGPMVGKVMAELVTGGEAGVSLAPFRPDRFISQQAA